MQKTRSDPSDTIRDFGERRLIELIRSRFGAPSDPLPVGIGDDAAVAAPVRGALQVLTTDALVEGVHFDRNYSSFADIGYKALAVNVSDIAAMGATPRLALLSLMLPDRTAVADVEALLDGFGEMAAVAKIALAGGNTTRSPGPLVVDVTVTGSVKPRKLLTRSGGRPGDALYVTGSIGAAAAGLEWLRAHASAGRNAPADPAMGDCVTRHRRPQPRERLGAIAGQTKAASGCMDLSDGLADAVTQVAEQSGTGATIEAAALPIHPGATGWFSSTGRDPVQAALAGGDDYELLFAVPARFRGRFRHVIRHAQGVPVTRIGELTQDRQIRMMRDGRSEPLPSGFAHF